MKEIKETLGKVWDRVWKIFSEFLKEWWGVDFISFFHMNLFHCHQNIFLQFLQQLASIFPRRHSSITIMDGAYILSSEMKNDPNIQWNATGTQPQRKFGIETCKPKLPFAFVPHTLLLYMSQQWGRRLVHSEMENYFILLFLVKTLISTREVQRSKFDGDTFTSTLGYKSHIRVRSLFRIVFILTSLASLPLGVMLRMRRSTATNLRIAPLISKEHTKKVRRARANQ